WKEKRGKTGAGPTKAKEKLNRGCTGRHPEARKGRTQKSGTGGKEAETTQRRKKQKRARKPAEKAPKPPDSDAHATAATPRRADTQVKSVDAEITKQKAEQQRLNKQITVYQAKLEAIPVRQQEAAELVRDYEISKAHYSQLLDKQLSAETATQLEIRQKGEKFSILDPAQPAEKPSKPNRKLFDAAGALAGLALGLILALATEISGMSIITAEQVTDVSSIAVLEVIPVIETHFDRRRRKRQMVWATVSGMLVT